MTRNRVKNLGSTTGPYVVFGYNSVDNQVQRLGGFKTLARAQAEVLQAHFNHRGIAKVTHPQKIWFYKHSGSFACVDDELRLEILTLLGV